MIVGALQSQRTEYTFDLFGATPGITRFTPARTTNPGTGFIGKVGVEALLHSLAGQSQDLLSNRDFQGLEIQIADRLAPHPGLNLLNDVDGQQIGEEVFF